MIHFIYGRAGSGKTTLVCEKAAESLSKGRRVFLIVPEQMAVDAEAKMTALIGNAPSLNLEILNFRRLCNRVFREYGGLSYNYITKSEKKLIMWQTLTELEAMLSDCASVERGGVDRMLSAVNELKAYRITPHALEAAAKKLELSGEHPELVSKLRDLSLIFASYTNLIAESMDDAADDLTKAAELLRKNKLFCGTDVYFDSFNGYTPQELAVLREIFASAENVTVSLTLDASPESSRDELFVNQRSTAQRLCELAADTDAKICETVLSGCRRAKMPELGFMEKHLWSLDLTKDDGYKNEVLALSLIECPNTFAECEAVAADILKRVRTGASWRDFSVITRGIDRYDGILDVIFEKYGIPLYVSKRTDISVKPLIRLILAALTVKRTNFRTSDVISYIKTGLVGLDPDETSELENYVEAWRIRGAARFASVWDMNPDGYTSEFTPENALRVERVNELRSRIMLPLSTLHMKLDEAETVKDCCMALYTYLTELKIPEKLDEIYRKQREYSKSQAQETHQLWNVLIDALDRLCAVMPELPANCDVFLELLKMIFDETDIGTIPCTMDEVSAGDASLIRGSGKHVYVIGANEGLFPLAPSSAGLFTDADREILAGAELALAPDSEYAAADERFAFYRALTSASMSVTVLWASSDLSGHAMKPSIGVTRLRSLFPDLKPVSYAELSLSERMEGKQNLMEFIAESDGTALGYALKKYADSHPDTKERARKLTVPLSDTEEMLCADTCEMISGGDLALTQSRLDSYVLCHFSYFCKHILKLEAKKPATFDAADIGTFIHRILELFVANANENGGLSQLTDAQIDLMVEEIITDYMTTICRIAPDFSGSRLAHLFARLRKSSRLLCKNLAAEFSQSRFSPAFFELDIKFPPSDRPAVAPLTIDLSDGTKAFIYGIADRVDIMEHGDRLYVRVVDYKTGTKDFSVDDVKMGLNLQMLLYLFSIWKHGKDPKGALEFVKSAEIVPAGVLYFKAGVPTVTLDSELSGDEVEQTVSDMLTRRGLVLDDMEVLTAMDKELSGKFLPIRLKKDGTPYKNGSLMSLEGFSELLGSVEDTIRTIGVEIKRGNASVHPICDKKHDACRYCDMKPVCRVSTKKGGS